MRPSSFIISILFALFFLTSCEVFMSEAPESSEVLAEPLPTLSSQQLALHLEGDRAFGEIFSAEKGLGPIFVQNACENCHKGDGKGNPFNNLTRFGRYDSLGKWDPLLELGGPQLQRRAVLTFRPEQLPPGVESTQFIAPNVTGLGYLAAVKDETILNLADPEDGNGDGVSGTVNYIEAPPWLKPDDRYHQRQPGGKYIGRFGRKSGAIDLMMQTVNAYKQDMGITSIFDPEDPVNIYDSRIAGDRISDPEVSSATIKNVVFYLQTLEAPRRRNEKTADVQSGYQLFMKTGCGKCHIPELKTGPSEIAALDRVSFYPYTDMLLHDMGPLLDDNYTEGVAATFEWRTMPLWGLGLQKDSQGGEMFLLHDGRSQSFDEAIQYHGGESAKSRENFNNLSSTEQQKIIRFLESL